MNFSSIYFFLLLGSGFISCALGILLLKHAATRTRTSSFVPVAVSLRNLIETALRRDLSEESRSILNSRLKMYL